MLNPGKNSLSRVLYQVKEGARDKEDYKREHLELARRLELENNTVWGSEMNIILYTDGSKTDTQAGLGVDIRAQKNTELVLGLPSYLEIADIELYAIYQAILLAKDLLPAEVDPLLPPVL